jgi:hypothetical protein
VCGIEPRLKVAVLPDKIQVLTSSSNQLDKSMKLLKKGFILILSLFIILLIFCWLTGFVLALPISKYSYQVNAHQKGDTINPLSKFDFSKGKWKVYLIYNWSDTKNNTINHKGSAFKTSDVSILNSLKKHWNFKYTGGDMATVESEIYFFSDGVLVFKSGIVVDKDIIGLQNPEFGWLPPINSQTAINPLRQFTRVLSPVIFL